MNCKYAPLHTSDKHCKADNSMKPNFKLEKKERRGKNPNILLPKKSRIRGFVGKGYYGCANHCPLFEAKE